MTAADAIAVVYLVSVALFAVGLKRLSRVRTSRTGNGLAAAGMLLAIIGTLVEQGGLDWRWVPLGIGVGAAAGLLIVVRAKATQMPEIVARFNGFGGAAAALVALALFWRAVVEPNVDEVPATLLGGAPAATLVVSVLVGAATFSGSVIAELKLRGTIKGMLRVPGRPAVMGLLVLGGLALGGAALFAVADDDLGATLVFALLAVSLAIGELLVIPIGGALWAVVIWLLISVGGGAAPATGFALENNLLIIAGTIVGAAGLILTQIMCRAMNRSLANVLAGGFGAGPAAGDEEYTNIVSADPEEAAMALEGAQTVIIVPGYGLAAGRAQHAAYELAQALEAQGANVRFAIHPVAGRMPGHMNVVLAEADVPYEQLVEMDDINRDFKNTDVAIVVGANDVVNPAAREQPGSPIAGMPILNVEEAGRVFVIKRSLSPGYAGIKNPLFERDNTVMLFGDAKEILDGLTNELHAVRS
jgi:H+-translocating NAD(P) transhydrogenase subunit beta